MADCSCITESWRVIYVSPSFVVSDHGRIMRIASQKPSMIGGILKPNITKDGYESVSLLDGECRKTYSVHRLVCEAFHGVCPSNSHQVAHNNGIRHDNRAGNLRWATGKENCCDMVRHGSDPAGARNPNVKLTVEQILEIRRSPRIYGSSRSLAGKYGVTQTSIDGIQLGLTWKSIPWEPGTAPHTSLKRKVRK